MLQLVCTLDPEISLLIDKKTNKESDLSVFADQIFCTTGIGSTKYSILKVDIMTK